MKIGGVEVSNPERPVVVAEIGCNHNGDLRLAMRLIGECAMAGADLIKLQAYTLNEILDLRGDGTVPEPWAGKAKSMRELYVKARTPLEWLPDLTEALHLMDMPWFSSVFGPESFALLEGLGCPAYKVAALDRATGWAHGLAVDTDKPLIASSPNGRMPWADLTLFCPPGYPQEWGQATLVTDQYDGISYHGTDVYQAMALKNLGPCKMIEVHVQLDDVPSYLDAHSSLTVSQLRELCAS